MSTICSLVTTVILMSAVAALPRGVENDGLLLLEPQGTSQNFREDETQLLALESNDGPNSEIGQALEVELDSVDTKDLFSKDEPNPSQIDPGQDLNVGSASSGVDRKDNFDERGPYEGGDMIITTEQKSSLRAGISPERYRWPDGQVPYVIDPNFNRNELDIISSAMNEITTKTCIEFVPRTSQRDYIYIVRGGSGSGCWSMVGRQGGMQQVNLQYNGCVYKGIAAHEMIHAIGFYHEQSRTDRDNYVTIYWGNIQSGMESNFNKYAANTVNPFGVPYDFDSIMHYSAYAFSKNGGPTLDPKGVARDSLGQRNALSPKDALKINNMYKGICPGT